MVEFPLPNGLNYPLIKARESNPLSYLTLQNRVGTFNGRYPRKWLRGAASFMFMYTYRLETRDESGRILWLERRKAGQPGTARDSQGQPGTAYARSRPV